MFKSLHSIYSPSFFSSKTTKKRNPDSDEEFLKYIKNDSTYLEREPLEKVCNKKQLVAFKHEGFWQCVDTKRDLELIRKKFK